MDDQQQLSADNLAGWEAQLAAKAADLAAAREEFRRAQAVARGRAWVDDGDSDAQVLAAFDAAMESGPMEPVPAFVVGPVGLQRRIEAWLADNGHGAAAVALAETEIDTILEASL